MQAEKLPQKSPAKNPPKRVMASTDLNGIGKFKATDTFILDAVYMYFLILLQQSEVCTLATEKTCTSLLASGDKNLSKND